MNAKHVKSVAIAIFSLFIAFTTFYALSIAVCTFPACARAHREFCDFLFIVQIKMLHTYFLCLSSPSPSGPAVVVVFVVVVVVVLVFKVMPNESRSHYYRSWSISIVHQKSLELKAFSIKPSSHGHCRQLISFEFFVTIFLQRGSTALCTFNSRNTEENKQTSIYPSEFNSIQLKRQFSFLFQSVSIDSIRVEPSQGVNLDSTNTYAKQNKELRSYLEFVRLFQAGDNLQLLLCSVT